MKEGYALDPYFANPDNTAGLVFDGTFWKKDDLIVVPAVSELRQKCITMHHDPRYAGHLGRDRTEQLIVRHCWWPGLHADVEQYVSVCDICQWNRATNQKPPGLLQPLQVPRGRWKSVSMDLITHLPETGGGHTAIVVSVDRLTKMVHLAPAKTFIGTKEFAELFVKEVLARHGLPRTIVSARDPQFASAFFKEVCAQLGISQSMSTAFHPQIDGQTERMNREPEEMLRAYVGPGHDDWDLKCLSVSLQSTMLFINL